MDDSGKGRLIQAVLRCYPARWRRRHGDEAAELATLLIRDGAPVASIACSYLTGAAREWLTPRPGPRLSAVACLLLAAACLVGVSAGLLAAAGPARAAASASPARGQTPCRPGSPQPVPGFIPATGHPQLIIPGAGHGRSCGP
jgi:hypothetical protein